ncbi:MAG: NADPH-dependent 7-cyano-7-deazaguanine reductase QueF [Alcanivoracaceae bacterium]|nr:NADPH-dependent 7-cyano-7-deazaguanine reductase QueF [Alcanivoracaceae bacterium]
MSGILQDTPLGRQSDYVDTYTPSLLCPVPRWDAREGLELEMDSLPFHGVDVWHAYEVSWLDMRGKPVVAVAEFRVPCNSKNIVESKSLKLYLNSFANSRFESRAAVITVIEKDLSACADGTVDVLVHTLDEAAKTPWLENSGTCIDLLDLDITQYDYDPGLLMVEQGAEQNEQLYSHLLRSRCPVTGQPDWATLIVRYTGAPISAASLLRYIVSLRNHEGFHEQIVERVFMDIEAQCAPRQLTVYGRFTRRGGLDINPFRSNYETLPISKRVVRQ